MPVINEFEKDEILPILAADTETHTLIDGVLVSSEELEELGNKMPESFFREHCTVHCYAWLVSDGRRMAWLESFEEFTLFCAEHKTRCVWWYNAKFDFAIIDWHLLTSGWVQNEGKKGIDRSYKSLHSAQGARYSLALHKAYGEGKKPHVHCTTHYDFCNIFGGGLAACLKDFDVRDFDGNPVRKLTMDYQGDPEDPEAIAYMRNDVLGLYHLWRTAGAWLKDELGIDILAPKPQAMTAGGIAKKVMLRFLYGRGDDRENAKYFRVCHRMTADLDAELRNHWLYRGGLTFLNPAFENVSGTAPLHKYDVNSMYPSKMRDMPDIYGRPHEIPRETWDKWSDKERAAWVPILVIEELKGRVRDGMCGVWYDPYTRKFTDEVDFPAYGRHMLIFADEFTELSRWYDWETVSAERVLIFRKRKFERMPEFVDWIYRLKTEGKRTKAKVKEKFGKLLCNSCYGKFAQNPHTITTERRLDESGACRLYDIGEEVSESSIMSVVIGAYITSRARINLLETIRATCKRPADTFVYCDTDSIATLDEIRDTDPYTLGAYKYEGTFERWKFIAPKAYYTATHDGEKWAYDIHSKGVNIASIEREFERVATETGKQDPDTLEKIFVRGYKFSSLKGINVRGGKALIPLKKYLAK